MSKALVKSFCDMVKIDSESGEEAQFIEYLKDLFERELAADCELDSYGNLIARVPGKGSERTELLFLRFLLPFRSLVLDRDDLNPAGLQPAQYLGFACCRSPLAM